MSTAPPAERVKTHSALASTSRVRLLDILRSNTSAMDIRQLAETSGLHVTTARFHLDGLRDAGLVTVHRDERAMRGRPRMLYSAVCFGDSRAAIARGYQQLAEVLAAQWSDGSKERASERAERAGRDWARQEIRGRAPDVGVPEVTVQVNALFAELGFDPELKHDGDGTRILMRSCPFAAVAGLHPDVVCSLHLGLLDGALAELGAPNTVTSLQVRSEPQLCVAHVTPGSPAWAERPLKEVTDV